MKSILLILLFPFLYLLCDITIRFTFIQLYSLWQILFYAISVISSTLLFFVVILILNKVKNRSVLYASFLSLFCFYLILSILGSYIFYYFNGFFPNYYTYEYFKNEPLSAAILLKDSINKLDILLFMLGFSVMFFLLRKLSRREILWNTRKLILICSISYIGIFSFLVVKIKKYDQCLMVDTNFSAAINRHLFELEKERKFTGKGLSLRTPALLHKTNGKRDFNVLVIVFESLRKQNMEAYGYERETTPNLRSFEQDHPDEFYVFKNPYTVSTTTMLAVPGILTGIGPYQSPETFYSQPIIWEYSNMLNYRSFFVSSHSLKWYHFDRYYKNSKPDYIWSKETSKHAFFNDLGIKDIHTINHVNEFIKTKDKDPFFGVVQLNATHYPYKIPKQFEKWKITFLDEYDNSILYQDYVIGKLLKELKKCGKLENTVIFFTSDHGESLKDHKNIGHVDSYYAETISIPLMLYLPKGLRKKLDLKTLKENISKTTSNIDIAPTLVEILGLQKNKEVKQLIKNYSGYSLFHEIPYDRTLITLNNNSIARFKVGLSLIQDDFHYIYRMNVAPNREELYHIKKDKKELNNMISILSKKQRNIWLNYLRHYPECLKYLPKE